MAAFLALTLSVSVAQAHVRPPVLGTWQFAGTAPAGFVRHGAQVAQITISLSHGKLHGLVVTGPHHYKATGRYIAAQHEILMTVHMRRGAVRLQAVLQKGNRRMVGTWYDSRGDDGGFVLLRVTPQTHP